MGFDFFENLRKLKSKFFIFMKILGIKINDSLKKPKNWATLVKTYPTSVLLTFH
jgi:hypothetical protein